MCQNCKKIKELTIFGVNISNYSVVCDKNAPDAVKVAVENFKKYILDATGVQLSASDYSENLNQIVIGLEYCTSKKCEEAKEKVEHDGFAIIGDGNKLFITAKSYRGVVFGVYAFLEEYVGVRFYSSRFSVIHQADKIEVPCDLCYISNPKMIYRNVYWMDVKHPSESNPQFPLMLRDNTNEPDPLGDIGWYVGGAPKFCHTIIELAEMKHEVGLQPCLTDENVFNTVLKNVRKWLKEYPKAKIISVAQNDSWAHQLGCQCENCRAIDDKEEASMGSYLTFINRIADAIKDDYPDVLVDTLAYRYTRKPPKTVVPRDNVIVRPCSIECCFCHPFDDPNCEVNVKFKNDLDGWTKIAKKMFVWDYTTNFHKYLLPFPNLHVLHKNMKFLYDHNVSGVFAQGNCQSLSAEFGELRAYLLSKLMWNPEMSEKEYFAYMDEFLKDYYGAGWKRIRNYIDWSSEFCAKNTHSHCETTALALPIESKEECERILNEWKLAENEAETENQKEHVKLSSIQFLSLCEHFPDFNYDFREEIYNTLKKNNITYYRVNALVPNLKEGDEYPWLK